MTRRSVATAACGFLWRCLRRMDAIILAAGFGTRLRPHTLTTPKPLLPIGGRPILDWILGALPKSPSPLPLAPEAGARGKETLLSPPEGERDWGEGVDRIVVVVHYLAEQIEDYLSRQKHFAQWQTV